jgi:iron complex outermembrane receptor protein
MKPRQTHRPWRLLIAGAALLPAPLLAQVAPTSSSTTPPPGGARPTSSAAGASSASGQQDETIRLAQFTVVGEEEGYYAPAAVSGTRTKTELINLPMNLNVLTEQFIKDIGATDLVDIVTYTGGLIASTATSGDTAGGDTTGFSLRGFGTHVPYRNGFRRVRIVDPTNISRVEVIKGPSSVLYGTAFAGGSVNYITKRPVQNKRITDLTLRAGSHDAYRAELDVNLPIQQKIGPGTLGLRFVSAIEDSDSFVDRMHTDLTMVNPVATYWFRPDSYITLEYERTKKSINGFRSALPYHPFLDIQTAGLPIDERWNTHPSGDYMDHDMGVFTAELVHRINRNFTLRGAYNRATWEELTRRNGDATGLQNSNGYIASPWLQPVRLGNRQLTAYGERGSWDDYYQAELVNTFSVGEIVDSQTLVGAQRSVETFRQKFGAVSPGTTNGNRRPTAAWVLTDPSTWTLTEETEADIVSYNAGSLGTMGRSRFDTVYVTNQLSFLKGRVRTLLGYRFDKFKSDGHGATRNTAGQEITPVWNQQSLPHFETPQYGVLFKPMENLSFFAQYSESVVNLFLTQQRREDGTRFMPTPGRGEGYDIGFKTDMLARKVSLTASVFRIDNANIIRILAAREDPEAPGTIFSPADQGGVQRSEGFDVDVRVRPFKGNEVTLGFANIDAYVLEATESVRINGQAVLTRKGHQLANAPKRTLSAWMRQDFGVVGPFKNVWAGAGFRFVGNRPTDDQWRVVDYTSFTLDPGQTAINLQGTNVNFVGGRLAEPWRLDSYTVWDLSFGGRIEIGKMRYNAAVSVKNLTDEDYLLQRVHYAAPRTFEFRVTTSF